MQLCPPVRQQKSWRWVSLWINFRVVCGKNKQKTKTNDAAFVSPTRFFRIPRGRIIKFTVRQLCRRSRPILRSRRQEMVLRFWCLFFFFFFFVVKWWRLEPIVFQASWAGWLKENPVWEEGVLIPFISFKSRENGQKNIIRSAVIPFYPMLCFCFERIYLFASHSLNSCFWWIYMISGCSFFVQTVAVDGRESGQPLAAGIFWVLDVGIHPSRLVAPLFLDDRCFSFFPPLLNESGGFGTKL